VNQLIITVYLDENKQATTSLVTCNLNTYEYGALLCSVARQCAGMFRIHSGCDEEAALQQIAMGFRVELENRTADVVIGQKH
jgi:hypothetical protein